MLHVNNTDTWMNLLCCLQFLTVNKFAIKCIIVPFFIDNYKLVFTKWDLVSLEANNCSNLQWIHLNNVNGGCTGVVIPDVEQIFDHRFLLRFSFLVPMLLKNLGLKYFCSRLQYLLICYEGVISHHPFSKYAKLSEKLKFLTP